MQARNNRIQKSAGRKLRKKASALITTLLVIVVLSTIVVAFMQSMSIERLTARSQKNVYQAELAVDAAQAEAVQRIRSLMVSNSYHAIGYTNLSYGSTNQVVTILSGTNNYSPSGTNKFANYLLFSVSNQNPTQVPSLNATNSVAVNRRENAADKFGWMGSPMTNGQPVYRECRAEWVYILQDPTKNHQPNRNAANYNPYIARYAWWVEDETSKIDIRVAGNKDGAGGGFLRTTNSTGPEDLDLGAAPFVNGAPVPTNNSAFNQQFITFRDAVRELPIDARIVGRAPGLTADAEKATRFYVTSGSYANDLSGTGQKRVNLNALVNNGTNVEAIAANLDDIIYAITGTHDSVLRAQGGSGTSHFRSLPNTNMPLPNFGNRFFAGGTTPTTVQKAIYMKKLAANIRDYIDADSQPTLLGTNGAVSIAAPANNWWNSWPPQALGKEAAAYLQESAWVGYTTNWTNVSATVRRADVSIDHYLEFFNPSTKDFTFPAGTVIKISRMPTWTAGGFPAITPADFDIDISGVSVPAGKVTVITTNPGLGDPIDPNANDPPNLIRDATRLVRRPPATQLGTRYFPNRSTDGVTSLSSNIGFRINARDSTVSDTQSQLIIAGPGGIFDALRGYGFTGTTGNGWDFIQPFSGNRTRYVYSSSLMGNSADGRTGDPRTLSEQLSYKAFASGDQDNTRFYGNIQGNGTVPGSSTFGKAAISFVDPKKSGTGAWGDYNPDFTDSPNTAYAVIRDEPMLSIGELGHIYDPHRAAAPSGITYSRGGGRTLKIGQADDVIGSAGWQNAAWRLIDVFGVDTNTSTVELPAQSRGKLNINSVVRDNGIALKAFLRKFAFLPSPDSDPAAAGKTPSEVEIEAFIKSIYDYQTNKGPFMERGELAEISFFSGTNSSNIAGTPVKSMNDRGREEIFRRIVEMITTRSDSFSVFAVGESIREDDNGKIYTLGRASKASVYRFDPVIGSNLRDRVTNYEIAKIYERK